MTVAGRKDDSMMTVKRMSRKNKLIKEKRHDVFKEKGSWPEPTLCTDCGALYVKGRWSWKKPPERVHETICPACRRIAGNLPAGYVEIRGLFFPKHCDEILNLIRNTEKDEKRSHPLERIIEIEYSKDHTLITTTGVHVARRIGEALSRAYQGNLSFQYGKAEKRIRVYWRR